MISLWRSKGYTLLLIMQRLTQSPLGTFLKSFFMNLLELHQRYFPRSHGIYMLLMLVLGFWFQTVNMFWKTLFDLSIAKCECVTCGNDICNSTYKNDIMLHRHTSVLVFTAPMYFTTNTCAPQTKIKPKCEAWKGPWSLGVKTLNNLFSLSQREVRIEQTLSLI